MTPRKAKDAFEVALVALKAAAKPPAAAAGKLEAKEIVSLYTALRAFESDCDKAQGTLRTIASA